MDWIHCNMCFVQPRQTNSSFVLTSCGHIFCKNCENQENVRECRICKTSCSIIELTGDVLPNVKEYFEEPIVYAEKLIKACRFQKGHRINLFKAYSKNGEKYQKAKAHIQKLESNLRKAESHIKRLERKLEQYERCANSPLSTVEPFNFTPYSNNGTPSNLTNSNASRSRKLSNKDASRFTKPNPNSYDHYRSGGTQYTPASTSQSESNTPNSCGNFGGFSRNDYAPVSQLPVAAFPSRTPPCNAMNNLRIMGSGVKR